MNANRTLIAALLASALLSGCGASLSKVGPVGTRHLQNGPIAFERMAGARYDSVSGQIFVRATDGTVHQLTHFRASARRPAWSPDGKHIVFVRRLHPKPDQIWTMNADGSDARPVSAGCDGTCRLDDMPSYSPDGRRIAFFRAFGPFLHRGGKYERIILASRVQLMVVDARGGIARAIKSWDAQLQPWDGAPAWSPDGRRVALSIESLAHPNKHTFIGTAVFVMSTDGTGQHRITPWNVGAANPDWSPDGDTIAFNSLGGHSPNLYTVHPDGSALTNILAANDRRAFGGHTGFGLNPAWSPDGRQIAFPAMMNPCLAGHFGECHPVTDRYDIDAMNADGSDIRRLTTAPQYEAGPAWGPGAR